MGTRVLLRAAALVQAMHGAVTGLAPGGALCMQTLGFPSKSWVLTPGTT